MIDRIATNLVPLIAFLAWPFSVLHRIIARDRRKRVLLVTRNAIAADHMTEIVEVLADLDDLAINVTVDRFPAVDFNCNQASRSLGIPAIGVWRAIVNHWDLIIYTNHTFGPGLCFSPLAHKLYVNHGLHMGKINNVSGNDGVYGREKVIRPFNRPYYSTMFAASHSEAELAIQETPELNNVICVVGYPKAEKFLQDAEDLRREYRARMGCGPADVVLHVISTWGGDSLYCQSGRKLESELPSLLEEYKVVVSLHPRFDQLTCERKESRKDILERFEQAGATINYQLDWDGYVAAADIVMTDHSSLCLYHVLLQHPMLLVPVPANQYVAGSTFDRLRRCVSLADQEASLVQQVADTMAAGVQKEYAELPSAILSMDGNSSSAYRAKILELLS